MSYHERLSLCNCWQALARQLPIPYNSEKKAKSVAFKIEDMRSRFCCFYIRAFRGACEYKTEVEILIDFEQ